MSRFYAGPNQDAHQSWYVGNLEFHLAAGSLFHVPVDCIVNSENNKFKLAPTGLDSVSSQLAERYNPDLQNYLIEETGGTRRPPGTVIESPGFDDYDRIYHAGHQPMEVWTAEALDDEERASHIRVIRKCVSDILHRFGDADSESVAFPLIGCGFFDLDPWLFGHEFMHELIEQAAAPKFDAKEVWLAVLPEDQYPTVLNGVTQALADRAKGRPWNPFNLGVDYIDQFEQAAFGTAHPRWIAWLLVRYAELVTAHLLFLLASAQSAAPQQLLDPNRPVCFGVLRDRAYRIAKDRRGHAGERQDWSQALAQTVYSLGTELMDLNEDRNDIAHGRSPRPVRRMREDVATLVDALCPLVQNSETPSSEELTPWTWVTDNNRVCVLDRWRDGREWRYLLPAERRLIEVEVT